MENMYELRSGRRPIGVKAAPSAQTALFDHLRSLGCHDDEITRLGVDTLAWRGAVYRAVRVPDSEPSTRN